MKKALTKRKILLIDDKPDLLDLIKEMLEQEGYER